LSSAPGFTGGTLDREDRLRHDADALAAATGDWRARLLVLGPGYEPDVGEDGRLAWTMLADAPEDAELVLLGTDAGRPRFAAITYGAGAGFRSPRLLGMLAVMAPGEAATWAAARSVLDWHARHRFCANCGSGTEVFRAGWGRRCPDCRTEHFPRTDPVVIMLAEHQPAQAGSPLEHRCLLGRQPGWPAGRYSALAGFLEPGESIEEAVAREVAEEAGVRVRDIRYVASQPWPFPSQLMIACIGVADDDSITLDRNELEDAIWVSRADVRSVLAGGEGPFLPPPAHAIAHTLLTRWAEQGEEDQGE